MRKKIRCPQCHMVARRVYVRGASPEGQERFIEAGLLCFQGCGLITIRNSVLKGHALKLARRRLPDSLRAAKRTLENMAKS